VRNILTSIASDRSTHWLDVGIASDSSNFVAFLFVVSSNNCTAIRRTADSWRLKANGQERIIFNQPKNLVRQRRVDVG